MVDDEARIGMAVDQRLTRIDVVPEKNVHRKIVPNSRPRIRSRPGSSGVRFVSFVMMMRMPTVPGVFFHSATTSATAGSSGSTGLTSANRFG